MGWYILKRLSPTISLSSGMVTFFMTQAAPVYRVTDG